MANHKQMFCGHRGHSVGPPGIVAELDLKNVWRKFLDDRAYLATQQSVSGEILGQRDHIQQMDLSVHVFLPLPSPLSFALARVLDMCGPPPER